MVKYVIGNSRIWLFVCFFDAIFLSYIAHRRLVYLNASHHAVHFSHNLTSVYLHIAFFMHFPAPEVTVDSIFFLNVCSLDEMKSTIIKKWSEWKLLTPTLKLSPLLSNVFMWWGSTLKTFIYSTWQSREGSQILHHCAAMTCHFYFNAPFALVMFLNPVSIIRYWPTWLVTKRWVYVRPQICFCYRLNVIIYFFILFLYLFLDHIIYRCNLGYDGKRKHFHCCYCSLSFAKRKKKRSSFKVHSIKDVRVESDV